MVLDPTKQIMEFQLLRNVTLPSARRKLDSSPFGKKVSHKLLTNFLCEYVEVKKSEVTPAPDSYKQEDMATKPQRFNNIHLGTDKKVTAKDIPLTPGPGHYLRVDEQYSRTFHHGTKYTAAVSNGLSTHGQSFRSFAKMTGIGSEG